MIERSGQRKSVLRSSTPAPVLEVKGRSRSTTGVHRDKHLPVGVCRILDVEKESPNAVWRRRWIQVLYLYEERDRLVRAILERFANRDPLEGELSIRGIRR